MYILLIKGLFMKNEREDNWIGIEEAAEYLGIKAVTLRNKLKKDKTLPGHRIGKLWKFKRSELDIWVKSGESSVVLR